MMGRKLAFSALVAGFCVVGGTIIERLYHRGESNSGLASRVGTDARPASADNLPALPPPAAAAVPPPNVSPVADAAPVAARPREWAKSPTAVDSVQRPRAARGARRGPVNPAVAPAATAGNIPPEPPIAREALSWVGVDAEAEAVWMASINDPAVDPDARKNLIEDLNEDGFPDPKHVSSEDVPLILNRMQMIEQLAPDAMDDVNADAFAEAYKDLTDMLDRVTGS